MKNTALVQRFDLRKRPQRPMTNEVARKEVWWGYNGKVQRVEVVFFEDGTPDRVDIIYYKN